MNKIKKEREKAQPGERDKQKESHQRWVRWGDDLSLSDPTSQPTPRINFPAQAPLRLMYDTYLRAKNFFSSPHEGLLFRVKCLIK